MNPLLGLFFDLFILCALGAAIFHARRLSAQFDRMQGDRKAFEQLIQALNVAAGRAEGAIRSLKEAAQAAGDGVQEKVNKARALSGELEIMVQAGDNLAGRLGALAEKSRKAAMPAPEPEPTPTAPDAGAKPRSRAEQELLDAVRAKQK